MKEVKTYGTIKSVSTVEKEEDSDKINVKIEGKWEQDEKFLEIKVSISGDISDIEHIFDGHPSPGKEIKIILDKGAQISFDEIMELDDDNDVQDYGEKDKGGDQ